MSRRRHHHHYYFVVAYVVLGFCCNEDFLLIGDSSDEDMEQPVFDFEVGDCAFLQFMILVQCFFG